MCRACDYYGVTADYILGRSAHPGDVSVRDTRAFLAQLHELVDRAEQALNSIEGEEA